MHKPHVTWSNLIIEMAPSTTQSVSKRQNPEKHRGPGINHPRMIKYMIKPSASVFSFFSATDDPLNQVWTNRI